MSCALEKIEREPNRWTVLRRRARDPIIIHLRLQTFTKNTLLGPFFPFAQLARPARRRLRLEQEHQVRDLEEQQRSDLGTPHLWEHRGRHHLEGTPPNAPSVPRRPRLPRVRVRPPYPPELHQPRRPRRRRCPSYRRPCSRGHRFCRRRRRPRRGCRWRRRRCRRWDSSRLERRRCRPARRRCRPARRRPCRSSLTMGTS